MNIPRMHLHPEELADAVLSQAEPGSPEARLAETIIELDDKLGEMENNARMVLDWLEELEEEVDGLADMPLVGTMKTVLREFIYA
jgi:hypothetical protein